MLELEYQPTEADLNSANHIDNARIYDWLSQNRSSFFRSLGVFDGPIKPFLATVTLNFESEIFHQKPVTIATSISKIGNKSVTTEQQIFQDGQLCVSAQGVSVCFDTDEKCTQPITAEMREVLKNKK